MWDTRPHSAANVRPRYADGWLSFECDTERRRLCPIPSGWVDAGVVELSAWIIASEPVRTAAQPARAATTPEAGTGDGHKAGEPAPAAPDPLAGTRAVIDRARSVIRAIDELSGST